MYALENALAVGLRECATNMTNQRKANYSELTDSYLRGLEKLFYNLEPDNQKFLLNIFSSAAAGFIGAVIDTCNCPQDKFNQLSFHNKIVYVQSSLLETLLQFFLFR